LIVSDTRIYINDITIQLDPSKKSLGYIVRRFIMDEPAHEEFLGEAGWTRDKYHLPTTELATALAMGHGAIPLSFAHERELIETADGLQQRAFDCIERKAFPAIDRYISEGNRQAGVEFSKQVPGSVMRAICIDRALHHNPGGIEPQHKA
jgi:hypothetical protein